jgi:hypothetical protein
VTALRWLIVNPIPQGCPRPASSRTFSNEATYPATRTFPMSQRALDSEGEQA